MLPGRAAHLGTTSLEIAASVVGVDVIRLLLHLYIRVLFGRAIASGNTAIKVELLGLKLMAGSSVDGLILVDLLLLLLVRRNQVANAFHGLT